MTGRMMVTEAWDITVADESQVHGAAAAATAAALAAGLDAKNVAVCELLATELATNLVRHAVGGHLLMHVAGQGAVQLVTVDRGPGIADVAASMTDGYTTGPPSLGAGLGACRRGAAPLDPYSEVGRGAGGLLPVGPAAAAPPRAGAGGARPSSTCTARSAGARSCSSASARPPATRPGRSSSAGSSPRTLTSPPSVTASAWPGTATG